MSRIAPRIARLLLVLLASAWNIEAQQPARSDEADTEIVETKLCTLRLAKTSGDLVGILWKQPSLEIIHEPRLGENFRLLLPRPGYEAAYFISRDQHVNRIETSPDGVICHYDSLRREGEELPVKVRYQIRVVSERLEFSIEVDNPTKRPLAEVVFGMSGGHARIEESY